MCLFCIFLLFLCDVGKSQIPPDSIIHNGVIYPVIQRNTISRIGPVLFIVNGDQSRIFTRPYIASIQFYISPIGWFHLCGATIIGVDKLVTAAHCLIPFPANVLRVEVGVLDLSKDPLDFTQFRNVSVSYIHENYTASTSTIQNDIGVIFLTQPLVYNQNVQPAKLYRTDQMVQNQSVCIVSGWGRTGPSGPQSSVLLEGKMRTVEFLTCQKLLKEFGVSIYASQLCAKPENANGSSPCFGDSGGPLMCGQNNKFLIGVVSAALNCDVTIPTLFTKVSDYINWINVKYKLFKKQH